jgi:acetyltransferase-like isoleucine patch superfamily enzyme
MPSRESGVGASDLKKGLDSPWKIYSEIRRLIAIPHIRLYFAINGVRWGSGWKIYGCPILQRHRGSRIEIGNGLSLRSFFASNPLSPNHPTVLSTRSERAIIRIGEEFGMTGGTICAVNRIEIGNRVVVGANAVIMDTDFHPLDPMERKIMPNSRVGVPVIVEDDVFIGLNAIILKGVRIGRGSVIGAGSVVTADVPPGVVCAGNPARVIRSLRADDISILVAERQGYSSI